jgi:hypothetical protein
MKILVLTRVKPLIYKNSTSDRIEDYLKQDTFFGGYVESFRGMGCTVFCKFDEGIFLSPLLLKISLNFYRAIKKLLRITKIYHLDRFLFSIWLGIYSKRNGVDLIFTELNFSFSPWIIRKINKSLLITQWFGLFPHQISREERNLLDDADILWLPCEFTRNASDAFKSARLIYLGCSVNPSHLFNEYSSAYQADVISFGGLGGAHIDRAGLMTEIAKNIENFRFYGYVSKGFEVDEVLLGKLYQYLGSENLRKAISSSKIVINSTIDGYENVSRGFNARLFEIASCGGGLQIVAADPRIEEFFRPNEDIVFYYSLEDLFNKIKYYLDNDNERVRIVKNAYDRSLQYTYKKRAENIIDILKTQIK